MDGVLANFDQELVDRGIINDNSFLHLSKSDWTEENKKLDAQVKACMSEEGFWLNLKPMTDALKLWNYCKQFDPAILTALPSHMDGSVDWIANEKWIWFTDNFGPLNPERFITCFRPEKKNYSGKNKILVDDLHANCEEWKQMGGIGILHTSAKDSIKELQKYV
jgi:5'(3')-deoxyribonucleotidase